MALATTGERPEEMGMSDTAACLIPILVLRRCCPCYSDRMADTETAHAWLYLRLSRESAGAEDSLENQERILRDRAASEGLTVTKVFSEGAGKSAYSGKTRPEWQRLLDELEPNVVVMAVETSRFSRNEADGFAQLAAIDAAGAFILTTRDGADSRREGDELPQGIRLVVAAHESREKAKRIRDRKQGQRLQGIWLNATPFGHRRTASGRLELDPKTAPHLRRMVDMALAGKGATLIAKEMNASGGPVAGWTAWSQMTVSRLLRSPVLVGLMPHKGAVFVGPNGEPVRCVEGPTIMTEGERGLIAAMVAGRSRMTAAGRRQGQGAAASTALLAGGLLHCGRCGGKMNPRGPNYTCFAASARGICEGLTVGRHLIEPEIILAVSRHLAALEPESADDLARLVRVASKWMVTADADDGEVRAEASGKLAGARERLARLEEAHFVADSIDAARFEELAVVIRGQIAALEDAVSMQPAALDIGPLLDMIQTVEALEAAQPDVARSLVAAVLESVTLRPAPYRGARFDPARLGFVWSNA